MNGEKFKVKFGDSEPVKVVLALSLGKSSLSLLDIIIESFKEQLVNPRAKLGYELVVVNVDESSICKYENKADELIEGLKKHYSEYPIEFVKMDINRFLSDRESIKKVRILEDLKTIKLPVDNSSAAATTVSDILNSCPNRASRDDLFKIIMKQLIKSYTVAIGASTILWGDNMSSLAEEVIALTVKGRGGEIHKNLTDGEEEVFGTTIEHLHPLRDVSNSEIDKFVQFRELSQFELVSSINSDNFVNKQKTINEVVKQYYKTVDQDSDNIVSTVVKTGAKLDEPKQYDNVNCSICHNKIYNQPINWLRDITFNGAVPPQTDLELESFQEWEQLHKDELLEIENSTSRDETVICFGCTVTISSVKGSSIKWPISDSARASKEDVLKQFEIGTDDEDE